MNRRTFIKGTAVTAAVASLPATFGSTSEIRVFEMVAYACGVHTPKAFLTAEAIIKMYNEGVAPFINETVVPQPLNTGIRVLQDYKEGTSIGHIVGASLHVNSRWGTGLGMDFTDLKFIIAKATEKVGGSGEYEPQRTAHIKLQIASHYDLTGWNAGPLYSVSDRYKEIEYRGEWQIIDKDDVIEVLEWSVFQREPSFPCPEGEKLGARLLEEYETPAYQIIRTTGKDSIV